jgi:proteasome accessory factor C
MVSASSSGARGPVYVRRFDRVTQALHILSMHDGGLPLRELAAHLDVPEGTLREEIIAYYRAEIDPDLSPAAFREVRMRFLAAPGDPDEVEPSQAEIVALSSANPAADVGVTHFTATQLARVYRAGRALLALEPDNTVLEDALTTLGTTLLPGTEADSDSWLADLAARFRAAVRERRRMRIEYERDWRPGVRERVVDPYRLVHTRRGWELDAGVLTADGSRRVGSFLLSGIRTAGATGETFEVPADLDAQIAANRTERAVDVVVPQDARWVVERWAESVTPLQEDEESVKLRASLLPPIDWRLGLILVTAGPDAFVVEPRELGDAGRTLARELLTHHRVSADPAGPG